MATIYRYINSCLAILHTYTEIIHIAIIHVIHSILAQLCVIFCLLFYMKLCCLLSALLERALSISVVECPAESCTCSTTCVLYGYIGTIYNFTDYQGVPDYPGKLTSTC